jgi:hypothetical protein
MDPTVFWTKDSVDEDSFTLSLPSGHQIAYEEGRLLKEVLLNGSIDGLIIEGVWGFNDLGGYGHVILDLLGTSEANIRDICSENQKLTTPTVVLVPSAVSGSTLKGITLVPTQNHKCYERWAQPHFGRPHRDFYYNVSYVALTSLIEKGCTSIGIAGLTGSLAHYGDDDVGSCVAQAVAHAAIKFPQLRRVLSAGYGPVIVKTARYMSEHPESISEHRSIRQESFVVDNMLHTKLSWAAHDAEF